MFSISSIPEIGTARYDIAEYVAGPVSTSYLSAMNIIKSVLEKDEANLSPTDYTNFYAALQQLKALAQNGASSSSSPDVNFYMSYDMILNLNAVYHALEAANIPLTASTGDAQTLIRQYASQWQDLEGFGIGSILNQAINVNTDSRSLQSMIELEYVASGNSLLFNSLANMQSAIEATTNTLQTLQTLQNISNKITMSAVGNFNFPFTDNGDIPTALLVKIATDPTYFVPGYGGTTGGYMSVGGVRYNRAFLDDLFNAGAAGSPYFNGGSSNPLNLSGAMLTSFLNQKSFVQLISSQFLNSIAGFASFYKKIASFQFSQQIPVVTATQIDAQTLRAAKSSLSANLAAIIAANPAQSASVPNTLANFLFRVLQDLSGAFANAPGNDLLATQNWIMDNQNSLLGSQAAQLSGAVQTNLTQAVSAAQSLNQTQQQNVQQAMFLFQEFYKSSSNLLQSINQIITRTAQGVGR